MSKQKNCYKFSQDMMPDWRDDYPNNESTMANGALTANDIDSIDIDRLYENPKSGYLKSHIFLKKKG